MREKFRQFMIGRYGTDGLNQFLSIASIVLLLISLLTRFSLFTWLGLVLLVLCYYRSLSRNISKRTEENYQYYALKDRVDRKFRGLKDQWANRKLYHYYRCPQVPPEAACAPWPRPHPDLLPALRHPVHQKETERPCLGYVVPIRLRFGRSTKAITAPPTAGCAAASTHCTACGAALR